jgi:hypothetical protein
MNRRTGSLPAAMIAIATAPAAAQWLNIPAKGILPTKLRFFTRMMPTGFEPDKLSSMLHYPRPSVFIDGYLFFRLEVHHE